ncbi:MAG: PA2169 family four-helix-bundle protein [Polaromonas sp.]
MALNLKEFTMTDEKSPNLDPITNEPGAHPVGTGLGAAMGGAAAGAAAGVWGGPVGAVVGGVVGAVAGGLGGKAVAESVNPTLEEAYWRENYNREPYYESGRTFDDYGPAYRLGLQGRTAYGGNFDDVESRLEGEWPNQRERSSLSWEHARAASRAAWDRVALQSGSYGGMQGSPANTIQASSLGVVENDEVIDTLNDLLESCRDGEFGFNTAAEHAKSADIKTMLMRHAAECRTAGQELQTLIRQMGGEPDEGGSVSGALHRGWVSVRGTLSGYSDQAMLDECERGEDSAVARYRKALKETLPAGIRSVVERQAQGAQRNHDQVKAMRDTLKAQG